MPREEFVMQKSLLSGSTRFTCWLMALLGVFVMIVASSRAEGSIFWLSAGVGAVAIVLSAARLIGSRAGNDAPSSNASQTTKAPVEFDEEEDLPAVNTS